MKKLLRHRKQLIAVLMVFTISFTSINWDAMLTKAATQTEETGTTETAETDSSASSTEGTEELENLLSSLLGDEVEETELTDERTINSTTYQLSDGQKKTVFYGEAVRYEDEEGNLVDYDASLTEITDNGEVNGISLEDYTYENTAGDTKNYMPENLSEESPVLLTNGEYSIGLAPVLDDESDDNEFSNHDSLEEADTREETVTDIYDEESDVKTTAIYNSSDESYSLEYVSEENGVKENIVLYEVPDTNVWKFEMQLSGLTPVLDSCSEGISFYQTGTEDIVGGIQAPYMNDASDDAYSEDISYSIEEKAGEEDTYIITMTVDSEYLTSEDRVYPVTIDPTVSWSGTSNVDDTYVISGSTYSNSNFYSSSVTTMSVGRSSQGISRSYLTFPQLSSTLDGMSVSSATLTLYETGSNKGAKVQAYRVNESWKKSTITWNNRAGYNTTALSSFTSTGVTGQSSTLDLTTYARYIAKGTYTDYGIMLRAEDESADSGIYTRFYSSRNSSSSRRPKLTVTYYASPTEADSVSVANAYVQEGSAVKVSWEGINSVALKSIQYKVMNYDEATKSSTTTYSAYKTLGSGSSGTKTISASKSWPEGSYKIFIRGVDSYGTVGLGKGVVVRIDGTSPTFGTCEISPDTDSSTYGASRPTLTWGNVSDTNLSRVEYSVNDSAYRTLSSTSGSAKLLPAFFTTTGAYTIKVRAVDKAGNYSKTYKFTYYYDVTAPVFTSVGLYPADTGNLTRPYIVWIASDDTFKNIQYSVNGGTYTVISANTKGISAIRSGAITDEGTYTIHVQAVDKAGNKTTSQAFTYVYDKTAPTVDGTSISPETTEDSYSTCNEPIISWVDLDDTELASMNYSIYYDDTLLGTESEIGVEASGSISLVSDYFTESGLYTIKFWGMDSALNKSNQVVFDYYYDGNGPVIESSRLVKEDSSGSPTIYLNHVADDSHEVVGEVYYKIVSSSAAEIKDAGLLTSTAAVAYDEDGNASFSLTSTDTSVSAGIYKIFFAVKDSLGNYSDIQEAGYYKLDDAVYKADLTLSGEYDDSTDTIELSWDSDDTIYSVDIYTRYGTDEFSLNSTVKNTTEVSLDVDSVKTTVDYRVLVTYTDGTQKLSNVATFVKNVEQADSYEFTAEDGETVELQIDEDVITYEVETIDTDEDGIEDVYEIWELNSNPNDTDSDGDGFSDNYEVFTYGTSPAIYTEDADSDGDGLTDLEEYKAGTNPFLTDSDFDGITDGADSKPLISDTDSNCEVTYTTEVHIGLYDVTEEVDNSDGTVTTYVTNIYSGTEKKIDNAGDITAYYYDSNDNNTAIVGYMDGEYRANVYTYDSNGNLQYITHNGFSYVFQYDDNQNLTSIAAGSRTLLSNVYETVTDEDGEVSYDQTSLSYGNGDTYEYGYSENKNVASIIINGELAYKMSYYDDGNLKEEIDYVNDLTYTYTYKDENVESISCSNGFYISYTYEDTVDSEIEVQSDNDDSVETEAVSTTKSSVTYQYDDTERVLNCVTEENESTNVTTQTTVLINDDTVECVVNSNTNSEVTTITKASGGTVLSMEVTEAEDGSKEIRNHNGDTYTYRYDANDNITSIYQNGDVSVSYAYDGLGQLTRENNAVAGQSIVYSYDEGGNITSVTTYEYTTEESITSTPVLTKTYSYEDGDWNDLLTSYNGETITYDTNGNPLSYRDGMNFTWAYGRSLATIVEADNTVTYEYNSDGIRTQKTVNGVTTYYTLEDSNPIKEETDDTTIWYLYSTNGSLVGFEVNGTAYYYNKNIQGDIVSIFNSDGEEVAGYEYDAWGNILSITGDVELANLNPYRYRGYYYDAETGFYYLQSRYYDSETGRFLNADDYDILMNGSESLLGYNLYTYTYNNPVNRVDYDGKFSISVSTATIIIDALLYLIPCILSLVAKAKTLRVMSKVSRWGRKAFVDSIDRLAGFIVENIDTIIYKVRGRACSSVRKAMSKQYMVNLIGVFISLSPGYIIASIIDRFDKDKKNGRITL